MQTSKLDSRVAELRAEAERLTKADPAKYTGVYRCRERRKGERFDKPMLPAFLSVASSGVGVTMPGESDPLYGKPIGGGVAAFISPEGVRVTFVRVVHGFSGYGFAQLYEDLEVELPSGLIIPAYRTYDPGCNYVICQTFSRKATARVPA